MAVATSQKTNIPLVGAINLNRNHAAIRPFDAFEKKNAPYLNDALSPVYWKRYNGNAVYDSKGNRYSINKISVAGTVNFQLQKNGVTIADNYSRPAKKSKLAYFVRWARKGGSFTGFNITKELLYRENNNSEWKFEFYRSGVLQTINLSTYNAKVISLRPLGVYNGAPYWCAVSVESRNTKRSRATVHLINGLTNFVHTATVEWPSINAVTDSGFVNICVPYEALSGTSRRSRFKHAGEFCFSVVNTSGGYMQNPSHCNVLAVFNGSSVSLKAEDYGNLDENKTFRINYLHGSDAAAHLKTAKSYSIFVPAVNVTDTDLAVFNGGAALAFVGDYTSVFMDIYNTTSSYDIYLTGVSPFSYFDFNAAQININLQGAWDAPLGVIKTGVKNILTDADRLEEIIGTRSRAAIDTNSYSAEIGRYFGICARYTLYEGCYEQVVLCGSQKKNNVPSTFDGYIGFRFTPYGCKTEVPVAILQQENQDQVSENDVIEYPFGYTLNQISKDAMYRNDDIKITVNHGYITGIVDYNANLLMPWYSVKTVPAVDFDAIYVQNIEYNNLLLELDKNLTFSGENDVTIRCMIQDRYILLNTGSALNGYDVYNDQKFCWNPGYNMDLSFGRDSNSSEISVIKSIAENFASGINVAGFRPSTIAASYNPLYEISGLPFPGAIFAPATVYGYTFVAVNNDYTHNPELVVDYFSSEYIDLEQAIRDGRTNVLQPKYKYSIKGYSTPINSDYRDLDYPMSDFLSIAFFQKIINNYDYFLFVSDDIRTFPLIVQDGRAVIAYRQLAFVEKLDSIFVIQNSVYAISNNKIFFIQYSNQQLQGLQYIADVSGMKLIGATSKFALFFSESKRTIFSFTGNATLSEITDAGDFAEIHTPEQNGYLQALDAIIFIAKKNDGDSYIFFMSDDNTWGIPLKDMNFSEEFNFDYTGVTLIDDGSFIINVGMSQIQMRFIDNGDGTLLPINVETCYYGMGSETASIFSAWLIRLNNINLLDNGFVEVSVRAITDVGTKTETKKINLRKSDFDKETGYYYLRYQPKLQQCIGAQLRLKTNFPIYSITAEWQAYTTQVSSHNI